MSRLNKLNQFLSEGKPGMRTRIGEVKFYIFDMAGTVYVDIYRKNRLNQWRQYKTLRNIVRDTCRD